MPTLRQIILSGCRADIVHARTALGDFWQAIELARRGERASAVVLIAEARRDALQVQRILEAEHEMVCARLRWERVGAAMERAA